jgi:hypothetical protein
MPFKWFIKAYIHLPSYIYTMDRSSIIARSYYHGQPNKTDRREKKSAKRERERRRERYLSWFSKASQAELQLRNAEKIEAE